MQMIFDEINMQVFGCCYFLLNLILFELYWNLPHSVEFIYLFLFFHSSVGVYVLHTNIENLNRNGNSFS